MDLVTTFAGMELEHPVMNAGGTCKSLEDVKKFSRSSVSAVMVNLLVHERGGNAGNVFWAGQHYSVNSLGLPSRGEQYYRETLPEMVRIVHQAGKKIFVNISGFEPEEYERLAELAAGAGVDAMEMNFGCPNIWEGEAQKLILSFYSEGIREVRDRVGALGIVIPYGEKYSPFSNPAAISDTCVVISEDAGDSVMVKVSFLTLCNTFPNAYVVDRLGQPVISVGLAGLGGAAMKAIALGQLKQFKTEQEKGNLPDYIEFIGVGGVTSGQDVCDYKYVGATLVQAATPYFAAKEDPGVYSNILSSYIDCYQKEG